MLNIFLCFCTVISHLCFCSFYNNIKPQKTENYDIVNIWSVTPMNHSEKIIEVGLSIGIRRFRLRLNENLLRDYITYEFEQNLRTHSSTLMTGSVEGYKDSKVVGWLDPNGFVGKIILKKDVIYHLEYGHAYGHDNKMIAYDPKNFIITKKKRSIKRNLTSFCLTSGGHVQLSELNNYQNTKRSVLKQRILTCPMYLKTDPMFYKEIYENEGRHDEKKTINIILQEIQLIMIELNEIYGAINVGIRTEQFLAFKLKRVKIMSYNECKNNSRNAYCTENIDITNLLHTHAAEDFDQFCLAYILTARDFDGVLGLAFMPTSNVESGICARRTRQKSTNTGAVSIINQQHRNSRVTTVTTLAHEIGHSLGSPHDKEGSECSPDGIQGNYLMYAHATMGYLPNNKKFSPCSLEAISQTLSRIDSGLVRNCFEKPGSAHCGNSVLEEGEECDCGYSDQCVWDNCCFPADFQDPSKRCKLRPEASCSPSQGSCCSQETCTLKSSAEICYQDNDGCKIPVKCTGESPSCPISDTKYNLKNGTLCNQNMSTCINGECTGSVCLFFGLKPCSPQFVLKKATKIQKQLLCRVHCLINGTCKEYSKILSVRTHDFDTNDLSLPPGSSCAEDLGFCDIFSFCRPVDNEGPIARLQKQFQEGVLPKIRSNWIYVALCLVTLLIVAAILIKVCGRYTPTDNPGRKQHKQLFKRHNRTSSNCERTPFQA